MILKPPGNSSGFLFSAPSHGYVFVRRRGDTSYAQIGGAAANFLRFGCVFVGDVA